MENKEEIKVGDFVKILQLPGSNPSINHPYCRVGDIAIVEEIYSIHALWVRVVIGHQLENSFHIFREKVQKI